MPSSAWSIGVTHCHWRTFLCLSTGCLLLGTGFIANCTALYQEGSSNQTAIECHRFSPCPITTLCNLRTQKCECENGHLVAVAPYLPCLTRKYLGESCVVSAQCSHIQQAVCVSNSRKRNELHTLPAKNIFASAMMLKHPEKFLSRNEFGRCECRPGFWRNQNHLCMSKRLDMVACTESSQCPDLNSHCDFFRKKCVCDFGLFYDADLDRCLLEPSLSGIICQEDSDCRAVNERMFCLMGLCTDALATTTLRGCDHGVPCRNGFIWDDFSKCCVHAVSNFHFGDPFAVGGGRGNTKYIESLRNWRHVSAEVWFKLLIFFFFILATIFTLKNRKTCLPTSMVSRPIPYDAASRVARGNLIANNNRLSSRPLDAPGRVQAIHMRVNLTDLEEDIERGVLMSLPKTINRRASVASNSSLPPYELVNNQPQSSSRPTETFPTPPPSYDQLPTYEEAVNGLANRKDHRAKGSEQAEQGAPTEP